jgi:hypothetical protein
LRQVTINNYDSDALGKTFLYQIQVFNIVGNSLSETASFVFATNPQAPSTQPVDDADVTSSTLIKVDYQALETLVETQGSPILSYNL